MGHQPAASYQPRQEEEKEKLIHYAKHLPMVIQQHKLQPLTNEALQRAVEHIVSVVQPSHIFLLGTKTTGCESRSIFVPQPIQYSATTGYFFVVLKQPGDTTPNDLAQEKAERHKSDCTSITTFVFAMEQFADWLQHAQPFATRIGHEGLLCYNAGKSTLPAPTAYDPHAMQERILTDCRFYHGQAGAFMVAAELYLLRQQYPLALFNIHQAAEQCYMAVIQSYTGLRAGTHNMDKLYRYSAWFHASLAALFPRNSERERQLFAVLQRAYIETRYKKDYVVQPAEVTTLYERIEKLYAITAELVYGACPVVC
jgi:uncharacterized protein